MKIDSFQDLFTAEMQALYSMEQQLVAAIPKLAKEAQSHDLKQALEEHLETTKDQVERLEDIGDTLNISLGGLSDDGMRAIIQEGEAMIQNITDPQLRDTAIMGGTEKVEHYEMAAYQSAINLAKKLNKDDIADMLQNTYNEEKNAADSINALSMGGLISKVAQAFT